MATWASHGAAITQSSTNSRTIPSPGPCCANSTTRKPSLPFRLRPRSETMTITMLQTAQYAPEVVPQDVPAFRPSEYTATLIHALRERRNLAYGASALEIGPGCGVVLAAIGQLGAASLCGVDVEGSAVAASAILLHSLGFGNRV